MAGGEALSDRAPRSPAPEAAARVALLFAGAMAALTFLLPEHRLPVRSFYDEWLAFALGGAALAAAAAGLRGRLTGIPELSLWLAAFALWLGVQALLRPPAYWQLPAAGIVFVLFAAALAWLGATLATILGAQRTADVLAHFVLAAAGLNALAGIVQFYGVPGWLDGIVATPSGPRSVGHVGQANVYAMYLAIGGASLVYLFARGRVRGAAVWLLGLLLALGGAYSQSRSALAFSVWLVGASLVMPAPAGTVARRVRVASVLLAAATIVAMLAIPLVHDALGISGRYASGLGRLVDPSVFGRENRPAAWGLAVGLITASPWLGTGWGEFAGAAFARGLPRVMVDAYEIWSSPHNAMLQIAAEGGLVALCIALAAAGRWAWHSFRALRRHAEPVTWWVIGVVGIVGIHSMVEYPLWYAHVLALTALAAGLAPTPSITVPARPLRLATAAGVFALAGLLAWTLADYLRLERAFLVAKGDTLAAPAEVADAVSALALASTGPLAPYAEPWLHRALSPRETAMPALGERVLRRAPGSAAVARHAAALALDGRTDAAVELTDHALATLPLVRESHERVLAEVGPANSDALRALRDQVRASAK